MGWISSENCYAIGSAGPEKFPSYPTLFGLPTVEVHGLGGNPTSGGGAWGLVVLKKLVQSMLHTNTYMNIQPYRQKICIYVYIYKYKSIAISIYIYISYLQCIGFPPFSVHYMSMFVPHKLPFKIMRGPTNLMVAAWSGRGQAGQIVGAIFFVTIFFKPKWNI